MAVLTAVQRHDVLAEGLVHELVIWQCQKQQPSIQVMLYYNITCYVTTCCISLTAVQGHDVLAEGLVHQLITGQCQKQQPSIEVMLYNTPCYTA
jgi:hypothetical protein